MPSLKLVYAIFYQTFRQMIALFFFFSVDDSVRARRVYSQKIIILDYHIKIIP